MKNVIVLICLFSVVVAKSQTTCNCDEIDNQHYSCRLMPTPISCSGQQNYLAITEKITLKPVASAVNKGTNGSSFFNIIRGTNFFALSNDFVIPDSIKLTSNMQVELGGYYTNCSTPVVPKISCNIKFLTTGSDDFVLDNLATLFYNIQINAIEYKTSANYSVVKFLNTNGSVVKVKSNIVKIDSDKYAFDVSDLPKGIYILKFDDNFIAGKIFIQ